MFVSGEGVEGAGCWVGDIGGDELPTEEGEGKSKREEAPAIGAFEVRLLTA